MLVEGSAVLLGRKSGSINWTRRAPELSGGPADVTGVQRKRESMRREAGTTVRRRVRKVRRESSGGSINWTLR